ncbi:MAG: hypothetical protein WBM88_01805 [Woeseiaceae bacterium]
MKDNEDKTYCIIDHANKLGDGREFDPYQYWLKQAKQRKESERRANRDDNVIVATPKKSRLT